MINRLFILLAACIVAACGGEPAILPDVPEGAEALSLDGTPLYSPMPAQDVIDRMSEAERLFAEDSGSVEDLIWYGRRVAYAGDFRQAIQIFSEGISRFPSDARLYRHRGHRYITIREFDRAIADLERASELIAGTENEIEPDGLPNALNIPVSTLHGNVWYHLGLAYYLKHDWDNAERAYRKGFESSTNDDNRVSTVHWLYMIMQRRGASEEADQILDGISSDMNVIENMSYHQLCLFYKGELSLPELVGVGNGTPAGAAISYGLANWYFYNGEQGRARAMLTELTETEAWPAFGVVAAEADLAALDRDSVSE